MIQHPIPQNVTTYQFRLIGDMTIQQFIYLAAGVGGAIFFYYTNLFFPIKWALVLFSALTGFAVAFLPLEDRPLDQWITNYIRAIYRPTRFVWKKSNTVPPYLTYTSTASILPADAQELARIAAVRKQQGLRSFLVTLPEESGSTDAYESASVSNILNLFNNPASSGPISPSSVPPISTTANILVNVAPTVSNNNKDPNLPAQEMEPPKPLSQTQQVNPEAIRVEKSVDETKITTPDETADVPQPNSNTITAVNLDQPTISATTATNLPFPSTPTTPDTIVGMVLDSNEKIVDNAIIEVLDEAGLPVRATKTNQLGQFFSTTPLKRGSYRIVVEKPGLVFDTIKLEIIGQIVNPLKIQAKN